MSLKGSTSSFLRAKHPSGALPLQPDPRVQLACLDALLQPSRFEAHKVPPPGLAFAPLGSVDGVLHTEVVGRFGCWDEGLFGQGVLEE